MCEYGGTKSSLWHILSTKTTTQHSVWGIENAKLHSLSLKIQHYPNKHFLWLKNSATVGWKIDRLSFNIHFKLDTSLARAVAHIMSLLCELTKNTPMKQKMLCFWWHWREWNQSCVWVSSGNEHMYISGMYHLAGNIAIASTVNQIVFFGFHHGLQNPLPSRWKGNIPEKWIWFWVRNHF